MGISTYDMGCGILSNLWRLPDSVTSTNVSDKLLKCALQILPCNPGVESDLRDAIVVYGMGGFIKTIHDMRKPDFKDWSWNKTINKVSSLGVQIILLLKGANKLELLNLAAIGATLGQYSIFARVFNIHPMLSLDLIKDGLIVTSAVFSIFEAWAKPAAKSEKARINNEIALTADKAKFVFLSLKIASVFKVVDFSTILVNTSYGMLTMGSFANGIGIVFAVCALSKAIADKK